MYDIFIWTIFNLFDSDCNIDSKIQIFSYYSKISYILLIIPCSIDIGHSLGRFWYPLENSGLLDWDLSVPFKHVKFWKFFPRENFWFSELVTCLYPALSNVETNAIKNFPCSFRSCAKEFSKSWYNYWRFHTGCNILPIFNVLKNVCLINISVIKHGNNYLLLWKTNHKSIKELINKNIILKIKSQLSKIATIPTCKVICLVNPLKKYW